MHPIISLFFNPKWKYEHVGIEGCMLNTNCMNISILAFSTFLFRKWPGECLVKGMAHMNICNNPPKIPAHITIQYKHHFFIWPHKRSDHDQLPSCFLSFYGMKSHAVNHQGFPNIYSEYAWWVLSPHLTIFCPCSLFTEWHFLFSFLQHSFHFFYSLTLIETMTVFLH